MIEPRLNRLASISASTSTSQNIRAHSKLYVSSSILLAFCFGACSPCYWNRNRSACFDLSLQTLLNVKYRLGPINLLTWKRFFLANVTFECVFLCSIWQCELQSQRGWVHKVHVVINPDAIRSFVIVASLITDWSVVWCVQKIPRIYSSLWRYLTTFVSRFQLPLRVENGTSSEAFPFPTSMS